MKNSNNDGHRIFMGHGDHLEGIMPAEQMMKLLPEQLKHSNVWKKVQTQVTLQNNDTETTDVVSLTNDGNDMYMQTLLAYAKNANVNEFMTVYPVLTGKPAEVTITRVVEWDNQIEATVYATIGDFDFAFFATDYYCNKEKYREGAVVTVELAALAINAEEADRGFKFEGQHAVDWLAKMGKEPDRDENGNVKPVCFNTERMVAFLPTNDDCPDMAQFQSHVGDISGASVFGVDFFRSMICIHRDEDDVPIEIPLYFRREFLPTVKPGDPLRGWLWLTGCISNCHGSLADICCNFEVHMERCNFNVFDNVMFVLKFLPLLKLRSGYEFDAFQRGDRIGWVMQPYCRKANPKVDFNPAVHGHYDESLNIDGLIGWDDAKTVPDYMPYFCVPFTQAGIIQAWLLRHLDDYMPKGWHANYRCRYYLFNREEFLGLFPVEAGDEKSVFTRYRAKKRDEVMAIDLETLLPSVSISITGDTATVRYAYWNDWNGLVRASVNVQRDGSSVRFGEELKEVLVPYKCGIRF